MKPINLDVTKNGNPQNISDNDGSPSTLAEETKTDSFNMGHEGSSSVTSYSNLPELLEAVNIPILKQGAKNIPMKDNIKPFDSKEANEDILKEHHTVSKDNPSMMDRNPQTPINNVFDFLTENKDGLGKSSFKNSSEIKELGNMPSTLSIDPKIISILEFKPNTIDEHKQAIIDNNWVIRQYNSSIDNPYTEKMIELDKNIYEQMGKEYIPFLGIIGLDMKKKAVENIRMSEESIQREVESIKNQIKPQLDSAKDALDKDLKKYHDNLKKKPFDTKHMHSNAMSGVRMSFPDSDMEELKKRKNALDVAENIYKKIDQLLSIPSNSSPEVFLQALKDIDLENFATLGLNSLKQNFDVLSYLKKAEKELSPEEAAVLYLYNTYQTLAGVKEVPFAYSAGQFITEAIPDIIAISLSAGAGGIVKNAVTRFAQKTTKNKIAAKTLKYASNATEGLVSIGANPQTIKDIVNKEKDSYDIHIDSDEQKISAVRKEGAHSSTKNVIYSLLEKGFSFGTSKVLGHIKNMPKNYQRSSIKSNGWTMGYKTAIGDFSMLTSLENAVAEISEDALVDYLTEFTKTAIIPPSEAELQEMNRINEERSKRGEAPISKWDKINSPEFLIKTLFFAGLKKGFEAMRSSTIDSYKDYRNALKKKAENIKMPIETKKHIDALVLQGDYNDQNMNNQLFNIVLVAKTEDEVKNIFTYAILKMEEGFFNVIQEGRDAGTSDAGRINIHSPENKSTSGGFPEYTSTPRQQNMNTNTTSSSTHGDMNNPRNHWSSINNDNVSITPNLNIQSKDNVSSAYD